MPNWPFRFLHAADFHLETPPFGVDEIPDHLWELFLDAPYRAAERVFDTALAENVDFVVLSGDLLHSQHAGPRGPLFLLAQFERLAARNIAVYWAGGRIDPPEAWPPSIALPENVHVFPHGKPEQILHRRADTPLARLIGASRSPRAHVRPEGFDPREAGLFSIAVAHGRAPLESLRMSRVDYWALGGRHARRTLCEGMPLAHDPGSPQGRQPEETGAHGCTLVEVDVERNARLSFVATDIIRWETLEISLDEQTTREELQHEMDRRLDSLRQKTPQADLLVSWQVQGSGDLVAQLRRGLLGPELLGRLRERFGQGLPVAWSVAMTVEPPARWQASWYEEDTIRGEFLRQLHHREQDVGEPLGLETCLSGATLDNRWGELVLNVPEVSRGALVHEAAMLGVDLLAGEERES
ncbi:MAG TPA: DNA repair exonuclease [Thermoguttaceae bacterium]|nr:DNA repair exonuclease [Thermoguttaceae bacterium]